MSDNQFIFLCELLMTERERPLFQEFLKSSRSDDAVRGIYSDFLKERGRDESAEIAEKWVLTNSASYAMIPSDLVSGEVLKSMLSGMGGFLYSNNSGSIFPTTP